MDRTAAIAIFDVSLDDQTLSDEHVKLVATTLRTSFRPFDVISRLDDKAFGVIITELSESSSHLFNRAKERLEKLQLSVTMATANADHGEDLNKIIEDVRRVSK